MRIHRHRTLPFGGAIGLAFALCAPTALAGDGLHLVPGEYATIQDAIDAAASGEVVEVADGVYRGLGNRDLNFFGKAIVVRSANGPAKCTIDCEATPEVPYRAFLFENGETRRSVVDGFTIMGGNTLPGAVADQFNGGAIRILAASPTIRNTHFTLNASGCWGGAVYAGHGGSAMIENCSFFDNFTDDEGGAFFQWSGASTTILNTAFVNNEAAVLGGAIADFGGGTLTLHNITVMGNIAPSGGSGIESWGLTSITSSIFWGNTNGAPLSPGLDVAYSNVQGGYAGVGNIDVDPGLGADGVHLLPGSPCIDAGDPQAQPLPRERDIDGERRIRGARIDMGADEFRPPLRNERTAEF